jgi:chromosome segregation ATPase
VDFDAVADELFGLPPATFIERRNALATAARSDDDEQLAARIKSLRRPTVGAALVNAFVRERRERFTAFLTLGADLRDAQASGDGQQLRALAGRRQQLMRDLDRDLAELASARGLSATRAVQQEVHATMFAALSDPQAEAIVQRGRLESALVDGTFADRAPADTERRTSQSHPDAESAKSSSPGRIESAKRKLDEANASAAAADHAVEKVAAAVSSAQGELADLDNQLEETLKRARQIERDRSTVNRKVATAQSAHTDAIRRAKVLHEAAAKAKARYEHEAAG